MSAKKVEDNNTWFEDLNKSVGHAISNLERTADGKWPAWSTGVTFVDIATRIGGLPKGRIVEIFGDPSAGKSTILMYAAAQRQKEGKKTVWLDFENSLEPLWCAKLGLNIEDRSTFLWVKDIETMEEGFDLVNKIIKSDQGKDVALIVWDSIAMSMTQVTADMKSAQDKERLAPKATTLTRELPRLNTLMATRDTETTVCFVNQVRVAIGDTSWVPEVKTPGGKAFEHSASLRLHIKKSAQYKAKVLDPLTKEVTDKVVGLKVRVFVEKNKLGERGGEGSYYFLNSIGIDNVRMAVEIAASRGDLVKISAQKYLIPATLTADSKDFEGTEKKVLQYFMDNPTAYRKLESYLITDIERMHQESLKAIPTLGETTVEEIPDTLGLIVENSDVE